MRNVEYIRVFNYLKPAEGGPDTPFMVKVLRRAGVAASLTESIYVGHVCLEVQRGKLGAARRALRQFFPRVDW